MKNEKEAFNGHRSEHQRSNHKMVIEIPAEPIPRRYDRIPSSYEPMGEIELRGRVFSQFAKGQVSWWVLITGWTVFGGSVLVLLLVASTAFFVALLPLAIAAVPLLVLWRGTRAKLTRRKRRSR